MKFKIRINTELARISGNFMFLSRKPIINPAHKFLNVNNCWYFDIYEQDEFQSAELSMKKVIITLGCVFES